MTMITFLGGEETGNVGSVQWGEYNFELNKPIECSNPDIIKKAMTNRFFMVGNQAPKDITLEKTEYSAVSHTPEAVAKRPPGRPPGQPLSKRRQEAVEQDSAAIQKMAKNQGWGKPEPETTQKDYSPMPPPAHPKQHEPKDDK